MEKKRIELMAKITSVSSKKTIMSIAKDHNLNPQEVFVRVTFKVAEKDESGEYQVAEDEYTSSNKLRFFGEEGYTKLLAAKESGELVSITVTINEKGSLMYLNDEDDSDITIADLFSTPVEKSDTRKNIEDLF